MGSNSYSPLLSIVIPTHNRAKYAFYAIRSILSINDDRFELVVSDTSDSNQLFEMLASEGEYLISDPRLHLLRPKQKLDMTGNHNNAMSEANGAYVCLIGDDDTITADIILATEWANKNNIEIIAPEIVSNYAWPDFKSVYFGTKHSARLYLPKVVGGVKYHDSRTALTNALYGAAQGTDGLPKIYHGIVEKRLLDKIKEISGNYFFGSSPDVSGAISLAFASKEFVTISYPLTIPGASGGSNTGRSAMNKHKGKLDSESQTKSFKENGWSEGVPKFFSVETVWAHAALETIKKNDPMYLNEFNYIKLAAVCTVLHPEYKIEIDKAIVEYSLSLGENLEEIKKLISKEVLRFRFNRLLYIFNRLLRPTASGGRLFVGGLNTIEETSKVLKNHLDNNGWSWASLVKDRNVT